MFYCHALNDRGGLYRFEIATGKHTLIFKVDSDGDHSRVCSTPTRNARGKPPEASRQSEQEKATWPRCILHSRPVDAADVSSASGRVRWRRRQRCLAICSITCLFSLICSCTRFNSHFTYHSYSQQQNLRAELRLRFLAALHRRFSLSFI